MKFIKYAIFLGVLLLALAGCSKDDKAGRIRRKRERHQGEN
ncbi:hypothetical protein QNH10_18940 [Sporosarcina thermotolerans]|nr:hypothetical protein [Sporosarcina thermotolerans]WHT48084.1 hypothetical protein QNH10_18940 [Sporosarcina thermotolerans]